MNENRQAKILEIVKKHRVKTQGELRDYLYKEGFDVTQATISRDIRQLSLVKELSDGEYIYTATPRGKGAAGAGTAPLYRNSVVGVESAGNILCIKCPSGMANAACVTIDAYYGDRMVGSIAGDDTIFILCKTEKKASAFKAELEKLFNVKNT